MYSRAYKAIVSAPPLLWTGVFLLVPYALMFAQSLWTVREGVIVHQWNWHNYGTLVTNPLYASVFLRTLRIAGSVTFLSVLLGYPLAYYLSFHSGVRKELLYQLVIVPLWVSYLVRGYAWKTILGSEGVLNSFMRYAHLTHGPVEFLLYSPFAVVLVLMAASKGIAGVPRASLVVLLATASAVHLPTAPILLILGVDTLMDMGRTMMNVVGNCMAAAVIGNTERAAG